VRTIVGRSAELDSEKEELALIPPVHCLPQRKKTKNACFALEATHRRIARSLQALLNVRNYYLNLVDVLVVLTSVSTPQIEGLLLSVRMARALTTHVCVCAT